MIAATAVGGGHLLDIKKRSDIDILVTFNRDINLFDFWTCVNISKADSRPRLIWSWH
jgi:hypothetical protein